MSKFLMVFILYAVGRVGRVFANGPEDLGSIPGCVIPKNQWFLVLPWLTLSNTRYASRVKWSNPVKGVAPSPTPQYSSDWKWSLLVALDKRETTLLTYYWMKGGTKYNRGKELRVKPFRLKVVLTPVFPARHGKKGLFLLAARPTLFIF